MTEQENRWFEALTKDRAENAKVFDKRSVRGIKDSIVEKYSDQAHFIYELLQNADDAGATSARFDLRNNELIFAHNGTKRFAVSDPQNEDADSDSGRLGDINSITSIANSNKDIASIGKFGVGFKAVFQYTATPRIYDPNIFFQIDRFIVPTKIDKDFEGRKEDETLFLFPFDHEKRTPDKAFTDISEKLRSLTFPLLFLTKLKEISFKFASVIGGYTKETERNEQFDDTTAQLITLTQRNDKKIITEKLWLFSRTNENDHTYSVGFFLDTNGLLSPKKYHAFCFFPTKKTTELNFIVHAPFLLTDSREGIKAGEEHNKNMITALGALAADCLVYLKEIGQESGKRLINDDIFDIIPYNESKFSGIDDVNDISFKPVYTAIKEVLNSKELLPATDGYASSENAYWAFVTPITKVFSNDNLAFLVGNKNAKWIFASRGTEGIERSDPPLSNYMKALVNNKLINEGKIIGLIYPEFIEHQYAQNIEWLHNFYKWISETTTRTNLIKDKPIFIDQYEKAVPAFDKEKQHVLFLPTEDNCDYIVVNSKLLDDKDTEEFIRKLGIEEPSLRDEIYNKILPHYKNDDDIDISPHFKKFFKYYKECPNEDTQDYIDLIKNCAFIEYTSGEGGDIYSDKAGNLYLPTEELRLYFSSKPETNFVDLDSYIELVGKNERDALVRFLKALGAKDEPRIIIKYDLPKEEACKIKPLLEWEWSTRYQIWIDRYIDGCEQLLDSITAETSVVLWNQLLKIISSECSQKPFERLIYGTYKYFYYHDQQKPFESSEAIRLRTKPWLLNSGGEFVSADKLTKDTLSTKYYTQSDAAKELLIFLNIEDEGQNNLTDEQRYLIERGKKLEGISDEEIDNFLREKRQTNNVQIGGQESATNSPDSENPHVSRVFKEIEKRITSPRASRPAPTAENSADTEEADEDDFTKPAINYSKQIERAKERSADEVEKIAYMYELTQKAAQCERYTVGWFKTLLELEGLNSGENSSKEISITFAKAERESETNRTVILKHPSCYIPQSMEELADIPLELHFADGHMVKAAVEVVNVKSYTLRAKLKTGAEIEGVDLSLVTEAKIKARNLAFLTEELKEAFNKLSLEDNYNLQENLCKDIEFVFGPPGTGKTTYLARNVILPFMQSPEDIKVLVLTPTNKAADVLTARVMDVAGDDSYKNWLTRFGATNDSAVEQSGVFRDKTFDIRSFPRNVTITTIARFPYDYFLPDSSTRLHLKELKWDYIVIDEASMIHIANIIYPLYKKTPKKFIIAGDPFQIQPISSVDSWKDENIYTMVKLDSFTNPKTFPRDYPVELLTTQYRSVPEIGEVFSGFAYGGVLKHNRASENQRALMINNEFDVRPLNIIKFPVSRYESIYRPKRLQSKSNYQVYSALFAFEFARRLSSLIDIAQKGERFKIGIIAPYRTQAGIIDKLFASVSIPDNIDIQAGTIHGFQGDECDIIIAVFNPPPSISTSPDMFLNKKNIINVSISRARDYLFILMPDDETINVQNLKLIKKVERLCKTQVCSESASKDIEKIIFGSESYLEDNSFSTSHQQVNVYGEPERRYEVRTEDTAVDVQIHLER